MTEIGELIGIAIPKDFEWTCPHPHEETEFPEAENDLDAEEEDEKKAAKGDIQDTKNSSRKLRAALHQAANRKGEDAKNAAERTTITVDKAPGEPYTHKVDGAPNDKFGCGFAAHHEIPGNDGLKESLIVSWIAKTPPKGKKKKIVQNIGYNINAEHNGIWLAGSYAVRKGKNCPEGVTWRLIKDKKFQESYVRSAILTTGKQFHDTHEKYSNNVRKRLDVASLRLDKTNKLLCPDCQKVLEKKKLLPPPYELIELLKTFSAWLGGKLEGTTKKQWNLALWCTTDKWKHVLEKM
jgi:hypothetical protein